MPQIEQMGTYLSQAFWLVVTFGVLYVVLWKVVLPRVSLILLDRQEKIDDDLRKAEEFKAEADQAIEAYEKLVADARAEAQRVTHEASETIAADAAQRQEALTAKIKADTDAAEQRIEAARADAIASIQSVSAEVAQAATARLIDTDVASSDAEAAVANALQNRN
jgi:F-type H+-transporting ATPase subunit b